MSSVSFQRRSPLRTNTAQSEIQGARNKLCRERHEGLDVGTKKSDSPVEGELFLLISPFIEQLATADPGFASANNEEEAVARGVSRVVLPRRGRWSAARRGHQKQRWFRRAMRWRTGCEGRISALKRRHGLSRCRYRGLQGMERWVGLGVLASNLLALARAPIPQAGRPGKRGSKKI